MPKQKIDPAVAALKEMENQLTYEIGQLTALKNQIPAIIKAMKPSSGKSKE
jgi:hypothetical protein